ncbi:hypothetical protein ACF0H5_001587 [Mactra antiquata]
MARDAIVVFFITVAGLQLVFGSTRQPDSSIGGETVKTSPAPGSKLTTPPASSDLTPPSDIKFSTFTDSLITLGVFSMPTADIHRSTNSPTPIVDPTQSPPKSSLTPLLVTDPTPSSPKSTLIPVLVTDPTPSPKSTLIPLLVTDPTPSSPKSTLIPVLVTDPTPSSPKSTLIPVLVTDPTPSSPKSTLIPVLVTDPTPMSESRPTPITDGKWTQPMSIDHTVSSYDKQTPPPDRVTTTYPDSELTKEMFNGDAINYDKTKMFGPEGNLTDGFKEILGEEMRPIIETVISKYGHILDLKRQFGDGSKRPEDVKAFFLRLKDGVESIDKLLESPSSLLVSDELDYDFLAAFNRSIVKEKLMALPETVKDKICEDFQNGYANRKNMKTILKANWTDCVSSLSKAGQKPDGDLAKVMADLKRSEKRISEWTGSDWNEAITDGYFSGLPAEILKLMPAEVVKNRLDDITTLVNDKKKRRIITTKLSTVRLTDTLKREDIENMRDMVKDIPAKDLGEMNSADVIGSLSTLKENVDNLNRAQLAQIRKNIKSTDITSANLPDAIKCMDKKTLSAISSSDFVTALSGIGNTSLGEEMSRNVLNRLRESADYDEPSDLTNSKFSEMGSVAQGLSPKDIKDASNLDFGALLDEGAIENLALPKDTAHEVIKRYLTDSGNSELTANKLTKLGKNIKAVTPKMVESIDPTALVSSLDNMKETIEEVADEMFPTTKSKFVAKIIESGGDLGSKLEKLGALLQDVPVKMLKDLDDSTFGDLTGNTKRSFNCRDEETCLELYKRVYKAIGGPGIDNMRNYTKKVMKNLGKVMCGMPLEDLKNIPPTTDLIDIVQSLITECDLSTKKKEVLKDKVRLTWDIGSSTQITVSPDDLDKVSKLLAHFDISELENLGQDLCLDIVEIIGGKELDDISKDKVKSLAAYALTCLGKETGSLTSDDIDTLGTLKAVVVVERSNDIDASTATEVIAESDSTLLTSAGQKKMVQLVKADMGLTPESHDVLSLLGNLVREMSDADKITISDESWAAAGSEVIDAFDKSDSKYDERKSNGVGETTKDSESMKEKKMDTMKTIKDAYMNTATTATRRRRSVTSLSCSNMQSLGSAVVSMTTAEIEAMTDSDFLNCASFLGGISTWNTDQIASLLIVAVRAGTFGDASTWSANDVYEAGIIVQALTSSEIATFNDLDLDAMTSIGQHEGWGETQLSSGFSRWLSVSKGDDVSTVTSTELIGLGHFACGVSTAHIASLSSSEYSYAASYIGRLTSCSASQLVAYCDLAETAFGAISSWDTSVISTVGSVIGGLTANEIGSLTDSQIAAITPTSISQIPASVFVGFSVAQISEFTVAQAQATTSNQHAGLSQAQLNALIAAGASVESSMSVVQASLSTVFVSCVVAFLMQTM